MSDETMEAIAGQLKSARRMLAFIVILAVVMIAVTFIDQGIKRAVIGEAEAARRILDEFKREVVTFNGAGTGQAAAGSGVRPDAGSDLDDVPRASAAADPDARGKAGAARSRAPRKPRGPGGDGQ